MMRLTALYKQVMEDILYIIAGGTTSNDGDLNENYGELDYWIVKLGE